jgi:hypothetical protein
MHDWTLLSVQCDWKTGRTTLCFKTSGRSVSLVADGVVDLHLPRQHDWGPSISVNEVTGPSPAPSGLQQLKIEMQSGDVILIVAASFHMPSNI